MYFSILGKYPRLTLPPLFSEKFHHFFFSEKFSRKFIFVLDTWTWRLPSYRSFLLHHFRKRALLTSMLPCFWFLQENTSTMLAKGTTVDLYPSPLHPSFAFHPSPFLRLSPFTLHPWFSSPLILFPLDYLHFCVFLLILTTPFSNFKDEAFAALETEIKRASDRMLIAFYAMKLTSPNILALLQKR